MGELWGYKLPIKSYQRGYRPTYRNSTQACVAIDQSYLCCIQLAVEAITENSFELIAKKMAKFCRPETSATFSSMAATNGHLEMNSYLFAPIEDDDNESEFIAPTYFSWSFINNRSFRSVHLWLHPSVEHKFLDLLRKDENFEMTDVELFINGFKTSNTKASGSSTPRPIKVLNLRNRFGRIRLLGPKSFSTIASILFLVDEGELLSDSRFAPYSDSHKYWREIGQRIMPGNLRNGSIISLLVEDPRLFRAKTADKQMTTRAPTSNTSLDPPLPYTELFWDIAFQVEQTQKRFTRKELEQKQSGKLQPLTKTPFKVPILLVVHNLTSHSLSPTASNRVDLICSDETAYDFWLAIHFANARAAGLRDKLCLDFEAGSISFPADCPDSEAGRCYTSKETAALHAKYLRRPCNRRINYWSEQLRVEHPFSFCWSKLVTEWAMKAEMCSSYSKLQGQTTDFYVLRDRKLLLELSKLISKKSSNLDLNEVVRSNSRALLPIKLENIGRGRPKRLAMICLPSEVDICTLKTTNEEGKVSPLIEGKKSTSSVGDVEMSQDDAVTVSENTNKAAPTRGRGEIADFLPLLSSSTERSSNTYFPRQGTEGQQFTNLISLNAMFPDESAINQSRKRQRNITKRKKRKAKDRMKRQKLTDDEKAKAAVVTDDKIEQTADQDMEKEELFPYIESCSRPILGRIVRGDYSFIRARGFSLGYIPLAALPFVVAQSSRIVLTRNVSSRFYYPTKFSFCLGQVEL